MEIKGVYLGGLDEFFDNAHMTAGGKGEKIPVELRQEIMVEITSGKRKIRRKYTLKKITKSTYKVMKNKPPNIFV